VDSDADAGVATGGTLVAVDVAGSTLAEGPGADGGWTAWSGAIASLVRTCVTAQPELSAAKTTAAIKRNTDTSPPTRLTTDDVSLETPPGQEKARKKSVLGLILVSA
jgi:hypothetical protein